MEDVEYLAVLRGERSTSPGWYRTSRVEVVMKELDVVVDDEETGVRIGQQAEANVRGPQIGSVVVLHERLDEHAGRERVVDSNATQVRDEGSTEQVDIVPVQRDFRVERLAETHVHLWSHLHSVTPEDPARDRGDLKTERGTPIGVEPYLHL